MSKCSHFGGATNAASGTAEASRSRVRGVRAHGKPVDHTTIAAVLGESHQSAVRSALTIARERWREQHPDAMPSSKEALAAVKGLTQQRGFMYLTNKNIHEALLPQLPGLTFGQVRRAAARVRDPQRAVTTYGQEIPVWEASQRAYVFPSTGEHVAGDQWSTPTKAKQAEPCGIT